VCEPEAAPLRGPPAFDRERRPRDQIKERYLFRSGLTSPLLARGPHYAHAYLLHAVYCQTLLASQLDFKTHSTRSPYTELLVNSCICMYRCACEWTVLSKMYIR
jgi:hypothetical protein